MNVVEEYLTDYLEYAGDVRHAVLIDGPWGAGKTYFINEFIKIYKERHQECKLSFVQVSLYGVKRTSDIDSEIVRVMCPLMFSKPVVIGKSIAKSLLKGWLKIDIDGDKKADVKLSGDEFGALFQDGPFDSSAVYIFDDLERCEVPIDELFGYLNNFVEHQKSKVILIANREYIQDTYSQGEQGERVRSLGELEDKIVGAKFRIKADFESFIEGILVDKVNSEGLEVDSLGQQEVCSESCAEYRAIPFVEVVCDCKLELQQIFNLSGKLNLRALKSVLWDFDRIVSGFADDIVGNKLFVRLFFIHYVIFMLEERLGGFQIEWINSAMLCMIKDEDRLEHHERRMRELVSKYPEYNLDQTLFPAEVWSSIIEEKMGGNKLDNIIRTETHFFF